MDAGGEGRAFRERLARDWERAVIRVVVEEQGDGDDDDEDDEEMGDGDGDDDDESEGSRMRRARRFDEGGSDVEDDIVAW